MSRSQNGWPVLREDQTRVWDIPGTHRSVRLARGSAGFVLAHAALYFHENVERISGGTWDEWGYAVRKISGSNQYSNHSSGSAVDLNATQHPLGVTGTFTAKQKRIMHRRLRWLRVVRWGEDYSGRKDGMHFEINASRKKVQVVAKILRATPRGRRIAKANR